MGGSKPWPPIYPDSVTSFTSADTHVHVHRLSYHTPCLHVHMLRRKYNLLAIIKNNFNPNSMFISILFLFPVYTLNVHVDLFTFQNARRCFGQLFITDPVQGCFHHDYLVLLITCILYSTCIYIWKRILLCTNKDHYSLFIGWNEMIVFTCWSWKKSSYNNPNSPNPILSIYDIFPYTCNSFIDNWSKRGQRVHSFLWGFTHFFYDAAKFEAPRVQRVHSFLWSYRHCLARGISRFE